tara:strand:+ start:542 stop:964 length:423 start_codon:yes stop_codon:yes gene_type:complete
MKKKHYYNWAKKAFEAIEKWNQKMHDLGGEQGEYWNDDLNCAHSDLSRILEDDGYDGYWGIFKDLENQDKSIEICDKRIDNLKKEIKALKNKKVHLIDEREKMIDRNNLDYKNIDKKFSFHEIKIVPDPTYNTPEYLPTK